jgi:hypothetical protein
MRLWQREIMNEITTLDLSDVPDPTGFTLSSPSTTMSRPAFRAGAAHRARWGSIGQGTDAPVSAYSWAR